MQKHFEKNFLQQIWEVFYGMFNEWGQACTPFPPILCVLRGSFMVECDHIHLGYFSKMSPFDLGALEDAHCAFLGDYSLV